MKPDRSAPTPAGANNWQNSQTLALIYAAFAGMWILFSDQVLIWVFSDPADYMMASTLKGLLFVVVTTLLLYGLMRRLDARVEAGSVGGGLGWPFLLIAVLVTGLTSVLIQRGLTQGGSLAVAAWTGMAGLLTLVALGAALLMLRQRAQLHLAHATRKAQDDRLRALKLLTAIADSSEDTIFALDLEGRFVLFNQAAERHTGKSAADVLGRDETALFPPALAEALMADNRGVIEHGASKLVEETLPSEAGPRTMLTTKSPLRDEAGKIIGLLGISRDITARKQAEEALRESESRFRALVEQTLAGIYIIQDGRFRYVNPGFAAIFGYDAPEDIIECLHFAQLVAPEDRERVAENVRQRVEGNLSDIHYIFAGLRRDGSRIDVEVHGRAFNYQERPAVIGMILDITARQAAEDALRASELRFHDIVNASADWIWEIDAQGRYTYASESVRDLLGYTPAEIAGKTPFDLMPPEEAERLRGPFADIVARRATFRDLDNINVHKDGSLRHVTTNGMPILAGDGALLGYRGLDRDISERKAAEAALLHLTDDLSATLRAIPDLLFEVDEDGRYLKVEATAHNLLAAPADQLLGHTVDEMLPPEAARSVMDALAHAARNGADYGSTITLPLPDGIRHFELSVARKATAAEDKPCFIVLSRDITARQAAEEELRHNNEELQRFNRATVGRELDMLEMKKTINALSRELGREPPFPLAFLTENPERGAR